MCCKEMSIIMNLRQNKIQSGSSIYFAEDNWNIEDLVLKENEILINRPCFPCRGQNNSVNAQDEQGFKYRQNKTTTKGLERWQCIRKNKGCVCTVFIRGGIIIFQRNEHNHTVQDYRVLKKF